ncbi:hypothetical protein EJ02DRAFT_451171 [Clathrospora elynae]|uniref:F-box domain-containing protein n=1 Tax=Clathrospora elynae TaxID=706981 RepID=A0A6A5T186_9PLEO|nr:hypothetical protein EJ02DRAFT_451171 [Clathrospora elynae]
MKWKWRKKQLKAADAKLNEDVWGLIANEIDTYGNLYSLCLVSHLCHQATTPQLYRLVRLDLSHQSHFRCLRQIIRPDSQYLKLVRFLFIKGAEQAGRVPISELCAALPRFSNLQGIDCKGSQTLSETVSDMSAVPHPLYTVLKHLASSRLTYFGFSPTIASQYYEGFKADLLAMMTRNTGLLTLRILEERALGLSKTYPEMLPYFQNNSLPKLQSLTIVTTDGLTLFHGPELEIWGGQGGFDDMTCLAIRNAWYFPIFARTAPKLKTLGYMPHAFAGADSAALRLDAAGLAAPLWPRLETLHYLPHCHHRTTLICFCQAAPLGLLGRLPHITKLKISRPWLGPIISDYPRVMPTKEDIRAIQNLCPNLKELRMDVAPPGRRPYPRWPVDVLEALCDFQQPIKLLIYFHVYTPKLVSLLNDRLVYRDIFEDMVKKRTSRGLPCQSPYEVGFKVVRSWEKMKDHCDTPDYKFGVIDGGGVSFERRNGLVPLLVQEKKEYVKKRVAKTKGQISRAYKRNASKPMHL